MRSPQSARLSRLKERGCYLTPSLPTTPEMTAGGVTGTIGVTGAKTGATGANIGVTGAKTGATGANTAATGATVVGASGVVAPTRVAGANGVPWGDDVTRGTVVPFGLDVVLLAVTAGVAGSTGVANTGMWDTRTVSLAISGRGVSLMIVPSIAFLALARMAIC